MSETYFWCTECDDESADEKCTDCESECEEHCATCGKLSDTCNGHESKGAR